MSTERKQEIEDQAIAWCLRLHEGEPTPAEQQALELERDVGDVPAIAAPHDDLVDGHAHVGEEGLVEGGAARHGDERAHLDAGRRHRHQQVAEAGVLGLIGLRAAEQEHHVGVVRGAGPDLQAR